MSMSLGLMTGLVAQQQAAGGIALSILSIGPQDVDESVPLAYTISQDDTVEALLLLSTTSDPVASDFGATSGGGADAGGYTDLGTVALTTSGSPADLTLPAGLSGTYKVALLTSDASSLVVSGAVAITTAAAGIEVGTITNVIKSDVDALSTHTSASTFAAAAGSNRLLVAIVSYVPNVGLDTATWSLTLGAQAFTLAGVYGSTSVLGKTQIMYIKDADLPGTAQSVVLSADVEIRTPTVTLLELTNVDQTSPEASNAAHVGTLSNITTQDIDWSSAVTSGNLLISVVGTSNLVDQTFTRATDTGGTIVDITAHENSAGRDCTASYELLASSPATVTHTYTCTTGTRLGGSGIEIKAA